MKELSVGFIGFGEAAYYISSGLRSEGICHIYAYDINNEDPVLGPQIKERANSLQVKMTDSPQKLLLHSYCLFCATSANTAEPIAKELAPHIRDKKIYVDINAASPAVKNRIAALLKDTPAVFVDGAVMDSVPPYKHKVPLLVSGEGAEEFADIAGQWGMNVTVIDGTAGNASAIKMFRSIFMKGFSMLLLETLAASHSYGVSDLILKSLQTTLSKPLPDLADLLLTRTVLHTKRRITEMEEVIGALRGLGIEDSMSLATKNKLQHLDNLKLREYFNHQQPDRYTQVIEAICRLSANVKGDEHARESEFNRWNESPQT